MVAFRVRHGAVANVTESPQVAGNLPIYCRKMADRSAQGKQILIIDDDPKLTHIVGLYLEMEGFVVRRAGSAVEGLEEVANSRPDLVIMDIMMSGMDGIEACQRIRNDVATRTLPVLMFSAVAAKDDVERARQAGANHLITKPYNLDGLGRVIMSLLS
jgi:CheY-like chemotaxis protein